MNIAANTQDPIAQAISRYANESVKTGVSPLDCVKELLETVRKLYDLDMVFLSENGDYPYELNYVCSSVKEGISDKRWSKVRVPIAAYKKAVESHNVDEASTNHILAQDDSDSVLHFDMVENGKLFGCLGLRCIEERKWTDQEREACIRVGRALFPFVTQRRAAHETVAGDPKRAFGVQHDSLGAFYIFLDEDYAHAFTLNNPLRKFIPEWGFFSSAIEEYCNAFLTPNYAEKMRANISIDALKNELSPDNPDKSVVVHRVFENQSRWIEFSVKLVAIDDFGKPTRATLIVNNITKSVQEDYRLNFAMDAVGNLFSSVLSVDLTRDSYTVIKESTNIPVSISSDIPKFSDFVHRISQEFVEPSFRDRFESICDVARLKSTFNHDKSPQHLEFKERLDDSWQWVKLEIFAAKGYDPDHQYVSLFLRNNTNEHASDREHYAMLSSMESIYFALYTSSIAANRYKGVIVPKDSRNALQDDELTAKDALERVIDKLVLPEYRSKMIEFGNIQTMSERLRGKKSISAEFIRVNKGWCRADVFPVERNENGDVTRIVLGIVDIDEDKRKELQYRNALEEEMRISQELEFRAEHDPLTQLLNRNAFARLKEKFRESSESLCFMLLDIDLFKEINDTYGHETGDLCLKRLASLLEKRKRQSDFAFRFGGDEFAIIFRNFRESNADSIPRMVAQINETLSGANDGLPPFSVSAGASFSTAGFHEGLYKQADEALYRVKQTHRGGCFVRSEKRERIESGVKNYRKSGFSETLYYFADQPEGSFPNLLHDINSGLEKSNGVGVVCGFFDESMPIYFASKLAMTNLGYDDPDSFSQKAQSGYLSLVSESDKKFYKEVFEIARNSNEQVARHRTLCLIREDGVLADFDEFFTIVRNSHGPDYWMSFLRLVRHVRKSVPTELHNVAKLMLEDRCKLALENQSADIDTKRMLLGAAAANVFPLAYLLSLRDETFVEIRNLSPSKDSSAEFGNARTAFTHIIDNIVAPESRESMRRFCNLDTLAQRLADDDVSCDFQILPDGSWFRARFASVGFMNVDEYKYSIFFAESIDYDRNRQLEAEHALATTKKELSDRSEIINALASSYDAVAFFDYENDRYRMISDSKAIDAVAGSEGTISTGFYRVAQTAVVPEYLNAVAFIWSSELRDEKLRKTNYLPIMYQDSLNGRSRADFFVISRDDSGNVKTAIFASRPIEDKDDGFVHTSGKDPITQAYDLETMTDILETMKDIKHPVAVVRIALSNLEQINQRFGSALGDESLVKVYKTLRATFGNRTPISRIGFNEFIAVIECDNIGELSAVEKKSQDICNSLKTPQDGSPIINSHIGIASSPAGYSDHLRRKSDEAVRFARNNGSSGTHVYNGSELFNSHLSLEDWINLGGGESEILEIMEGPLCMQSFFVSVDLEKDTYSFYKTKDLPPIEVGFNGCFSKLAASCTYLHPNDSPDSTMADILNPDAVRSALQNGRDHLTYDFTSESDGQLWMNVQVICTKRNADGDAVKLLCGIRDITDEIRRKELRERLPQVLYHSAFLAVGVIDANSKIATLASGSLPNLPIEAGETFNISEYLKNSVAPLLDPEKRGDFLDEYAIDTVQKHLESNEIYDAFVTYKKSEDDVAAIELHFRYLDKTKGLIVFAIEDITDRIEFDPITQKKNMLGFVRSSNEIMAKVDPRSLCILYFNVKGFKAVNETYGYSYGNEVLRRISDTLNDSALNPLLVTRESGDHFFCLIKLDNLSPREIERLSHMGDFDNQHPLHLHIECGLYPLTNGESIRKACDKARFATEVNEETRNRPYIVFDEKINKQYVEQAKMFAMLQDAFSRNEFVTYYQPIYDAKTKEVVAAEALVRWSSPDRGIVSPGVFVPILEKRGLIPQLDITVFDNVEQFQRKRIVGGKETVPISVNLSRIDIASSSTRAVIEQRIQDLVIDNSLIRLEVTESAYIDTPDSCIEMLDSLHERNTPIMIDDFGSGYSSFSAIAAHQFDIVKLDMSFVQLIGTSDRAETVVESSISLCHSMNAKVVAEGVETKEQYEFLRKNNCDYIQGYLFSEPIDEESFTALLDSIEQNNVSA